MFVYNVTIKVATEISNEWMEWLKQEHIPEVMATGCFVDFSIFKLLEIDDSEGPTFAIQYKAESKSFYNQYLEKHAQLLRQKSFDKWGDKFIAFRSIMQIVN